MFLSTLYRILQHYNCMSSHTEHIGGPRVQNCLELHHRNNLLGSCTHFPCLHSFRSLLIYLFLSYLIRWASFDFRAQSTADTSNPRLLILITQTSAYERTGDWVQRTAGVEDLWPAGYFHGIRLDRSFIYLSNQHRPHTSNEKASL